MRNDTGHGLYTAKDINRFLEISPKTLYHWVQTRGLVKPKIIGEGRGKSNYFDMDNLADLYLAKIFDTHGIELRHIKWIIDHLVPEKPKKIFAISEDEKFGLFWVLGREGNTLGFGFYNIWEAYRQKKEYFKTVGLRLCLSSPPLRSDGYRVNIASRRFDPLETGKTSFRSALIVNILRIVEEIESKTEVRF